MNMGSAVMDSDEQRSARYLTVKEAAEICRVHPITMRGWITAGKLPAKQAGRKYLIAPADLDAFLTPED